MNAVCLLFHAHRAWSLGKYTYFDVGVRHDYFGTEENRLRLEDRIERRYAPALRLLAALLERHRRFAFGLTLSSSLVDQLRRFAPQVLRDVRRVVATGRAEPLATTSHRSLAWEVSPEESEAQVEKHREDLGRELGAEPRLFGGEEIPDVSGLAAGLEARGFRGMMLLGDVSRSVPTDGPFRASTARGLPVTVARIPRLEAPEAVQGDLSCFALDLDASGEDETGAISPASWRLESLASWIDGLAARRDVLFRLPSQAVARRAAPDELPPLVRVRRFENEMQRDAWSRLAALASPAKDEDPANLEDFRRLTSSRQFERMAFGAASDLDAPYETYMAFRHAVSDLERRLAPTSLAAPDRLRQPSA